jgi:tryptophanyl-tRNA synthetase
MRKEKFKVTPWEVSGEIDYARLIKEFGLKPISGLPKELEKDVLFRRGIIFAHRDFGKIIDAVQKKKKFAMMTGLMPTGKFHIGHLILAKQILLYQKLGADIYIAVADVEAYNSKGQSLEESRKIALEQYIANYIALGLDLKKCDIYFQSDRSKNGKKAGAYYRLENVLGRHATFNEFKAVYGDVTPGKIVSSLLQASDMLHPQLKEFSGSRVPILIPVGVDQDPHLRIARDMARRVKLEGMSSTYHKLVPGLKKGKMSSSDDMSFIALTDSANEVENKIKKYAFSGGKDTLEEHRKKGGNTDVDVSFQYLRFFFEDDDKKLAKIKKDYESGKLLTGDLKKIVIVKINKFLKEHQAKLKKVEKEVKKFV